MGDDNPCGRVGGGRARIVLGICVTCSQRVGGSLGRYARVCARMRLFFTESSYQATVFRPPWCVCLFLLLMLGMPLGIMGRSSCVVPGLSICIVTRFSFHRHSFPPQCDLMWMREEVWARRVGKGCGGREDRCFLIHPAKFTPGESQNKGYTKNEATSIVVIQHAKNHGGHVVRSAPFLALCALLGYNTRLLSPSDHRQ